MTTPPNLPADCHTHRPGRPILTAALVAATALFTACASSVPAPNQQVLASEAAVTSATSAGAADLAPTTVLNEGITPDRVTTLRHGETNPVASNASAEGTLTHDQS